MVRSYPSKSLMVAEFFHDIFAMTTPISTHTMTHATLVGHRDVQSVVGAILGPHNLISALHLMLLFQS